MCKRPMNKFKHQRKFAKQVKRAIKKLEPHQFVCTLVDAIVEDCSGELLLARLSEEIDDRDDDQQYDEDYEEEEYESYDDDLDDDYDEEEPDWLDGRSLRDLRSMDPLWLSVEHGIDVAQLPPRDRL